MNLEQFIQKLPKAELHLHIEGSLEPELMFELAKRNNITLPYANVEAIRDAYQFSNLQDFLDIYYAGASVLITEQDFYDLTWAYLKRCELNRVVHTEIFFDPQTHTERNIDIGIVIQGIHRALKDGEKQLGITSRMIMCFLRHLSEEAAFETLKQAEPYRTLITGIGLDSSEVGNPPEKFERVYAAAIQQGYRSVAHAGEEGDASYIWGAIEQLKVSRIDHGVRAIEDDTLMQKLIQEQIPLTVCPLSNLKLKVFSCLEEHNLKILLNAGVKVTINSDDPAYFGGYMNDNFIASMQALELSYQDLATLSKNAFQAAFISEQEKNMYCSEVEALLAQATKA